MIQGFLSIKKTLLASLFTLTFLGVGVLFTSAAPAPSVISYQGFLTSATGTAQTGTTTVTVRFYDASAGGVLLFEELHPTVPVTNGYFTIQVGSVGDVNGGTVASAITDLSFDRSYYFTVELDAPFSTGEMTLAGGTRSQLGSVPFAKVAYGALQATSSTGLTTEKGRMYFNTGDNQLYIYNGTSWNPLSVQSSTFSTLTVTGTTSLQAASTTALSVVGQTTLNTASATGITSTNIYGTNGVITNATATNLFASEATFTNSTSSTFFATLLNAVTAVITNLTVVNATTTNLVASNSTSTNSFISSLVATLASITDLVVGNSTTTNAVITNATTTILSVSGQTTLSTASSSALTTDTLYGSTVLIATTSNTFDSSKLVVQGTTTLVGSAGSPTALRVMGNIDNTLSAGVAPRLVSTISTGDSPMALAVSGKYVYVANYNDSTLSIFDVLDASRPTLVATTTFGSQISAMYIDGSYLYFTSSNAHSLNIVDVSRPANPVLVSSVPVGSTPFSIYISGSYAYVGNLSSDSVSIVDISTPSSPVVVSTVAVGSLPYSVYVSGHYLYVTNGVSNDLSIVDISNPKSPSLIANHPTEATPRSVYVSGRYAYVANNISNSLSIIDISNPAVPVTIATSTVGNTPYSVYVSGRYVYVTNAGSDTLSVVDVSNPTSPVQLSDFSSGGSSPLSIKISGRHAFVINSVSNTLSVFDLGGLESTSAIIHSLDAGNLAVRNDLQVEGKLSVSTGLTVGVGGFASQGSGAVYGSLTVGTSTYPNFLVNATNNTVNIGTSTGLASLFVQGTSTLNPFTVASSTGGSLFGVDVLGRVILGASNDIEKNTFINGGPSYAYPSFRNIAIGYDSFANASTTSLDDMTDNVAIGYQALFGSSTDPQHGNNNIAIGHHAIFSNISGYENIAIGGNALRDNISGYSNLALGVNSLMSNVSGTDNIALGLSSLSGNISGVGNIAQGYLSLNGNVDGSHNIALGEAALYYNISGSNNIALGELAGVSDYLDGEAGASVADSFSGFFGYKASRETYLASSTSLTNAWAIGQEAKVGQSNTIVFGSSASSTLAMKVGIGTSTPSSRLDIYEPTTATSTEVFRILSNVTSTGDPVFKITANGDVFTDGNTTIGTPADLAEKYSTHDVSIVAGMVVTLATGTEAWDQVESDGVTKTPYTLSTVKKARVGDTALGVISTRPGILLGGSTEKGTPVAFSGRVPVYVTGPVKKGDYLTVSSTTEGYAMALTESGHSIGRALSDSDESATSSRIMMVVENKEHTATLSQIEGLTYVTSVASSTTLATSVESSLVGRLVNGLSVVKEYVAVKVSAVAGYFDKLFAREVYTESLEAKMICLGEGNNKTCVTKEKLDALLLLDLGGQKNQNNGEIDEVSSEAGGSSSGLSGDLEEGIINGTSTEGGTISNENSATSTDSIP